MSTNVIQTSFAGGELSPSLYARVDLAKYHIGAALLSNFFVDYRGGASTRPGFELVCRVRDSAHEVIIIPFQFSTIQTYELEFGDRYMRVIKDGGLVLEASQVLTGITQANPGVVTKAAHGYSNGDLVYLTVVGMTLLNAREFFVSGATANTFTLTDWNGNVINTSGYGAFVSGTVARVYTVTSPYAAEDLALLKYTQSADVLTLTHPDYPTYDLNRLSEISWAFTAVVIGSTISAPTGLAGVATGAGTAAYAYVVTAIGDDGESIASTRADVTGAVNIAATAGSIALNWNPVVGAVAYNVYKASPVSSGIIPAGVLFGYITQASTNASVDTNIVPDFTQSPPQARNPFASANYPSAVAYYQQRRVYAASNDNPETFWMSRPGLYDNFDVSSPVIASDAITGTLVSRQVNNIKYMIAMPGGLVTLTGGGAWQINGGSGDAAVTPSAIVATPQAYNGCADVEPLTINYNILYVQDRGATVRDLSYNFNINIYTGADLSILSNHLFTGYSITSWTYAEEPFKVVWAARSDGAMLSLTYLKDQEVYGWAQHHTQGRVKWISSIREGQENAVYAVVERSIGGQIIKFIERMHSRRMPYGAEDAFAVDCGLSSTQYYGVGTLVAAAASGTGVVFTSTVAEFTVGVHEGCVIRMGGGIATIDSVDASGLFVTCTITQDITDVDNGRDPTVVWPQVAGTWTFDQPFITFTGLDHLEGETAAILGDGNVFPQQVVSGGKITLSEPCTKAVAGLPYIAKLQTLYLDVGEPTIQGKRKFLPAMTARVDQTRGLKMGPTFDDLVEFKDRDLDTIGQPIGLYTGDQRMLIEQRWATEGQMCIQQDNPLPATVLGVIPEIQVGDTGK